MLIMSLSTGKSTDFPWDFPSHMLADPMLAVKIVMQANKQLNSLLAGLHKHAACRPFQDDICHVFPVACKLIVCE